MNQKVIDELQKALEAFVNDAHWSEGRGWTIGPMVNEPGGKLANAKNAIELAKRHKQPRTESEKRDEEVYKLVSDWDDGSIGPGELLDNVIDLYEPILE